jgi:23S rRNA (adenine2503-C2)-methyltransferase
LNILELTFPELADEFQKRYSKGEYHAAGVYREVFQKGNFDFGRVREFINSRELASRIATDLKFSPGKVIEEKKEGQLKKFITRLRDGNKIESVIIPMHTHYTLCVSSQAGCRMGCKFCQTGQLGFIRNLSVEEITGQVYSAKFRFSLNVRNIVFMGMGEPFDNFDNVIQAIRVLNEQRGFDVALRYITISTVGIIDGIQSLAKTGLKGIRLAISLNAPNDTIRSKIMPTTRMASMKTLRKILLEYPLSKKETFFITYVLIKNINDSCEHADELAAYLKPFRAKVNIIPHNPRSNSPFCSPSDGEVDQFCRWLVEQKIFVRKRSAKGQEILAACGQLGQTLSANV